MKRRHLLALPVVAVAIALWLYARHGGARIPVHYHLGAAAPSLRQIDLDFRDADDNPAFDSHLKFPTGATEDLYRTVRLLDGRYRVAAHLVWSDGREALLQRSIEVHGADHPIEIDLSQPASLTAP